MPVVEHFLSEMPNADINNWCYAAFHTTLKTIVNMDEAGDHPDQKIVPGSMPSEWKIKKGQLKVHCVNGKPVCLGKGGFGVVLYGQVHKENVAIKLIEHTGQDGGMLNEIAIMEKAKSKYVVRFMGYSTCPDGLLVALEYMSGGNLHRALQTGQDYQWHNK